MIDKTKIKAIAFDFGGTLDSPFLHWMDIYIKLYNEEFSLELNKENFYDIYVQTERMLDNERVVKSNFSLFETQYCKAQSHLLALAERKFITQATPALIERAAQLITDYSSSYVRLAEPILAELSRKYKLLLVSNYYGNLRKVVKDLGIDLYFSSLTDSTIENIRKPDSALWSLAITREGLNPENVLIVGDSKKNDILPGLSIGCQVVQGCSTVESSDEGISCIYSIDDLLSLV